MAATIELRLQVDGISCGNCVNAVETAVLGVVGVVEASVQLDGTATVRVTSDDITELVVAAVEGAGKSVAIMNPAAAPAPAVEAPGLGPRCADCSGDGVAIAAATPPPTIGVC